ncbi:hypothetical protein QQS21_011320 [Conoideocrella luteorostrata]|uniref:Uncharacterized protein n=1 Tax=Conoideocrella luteorostrata TaxID=1105319 RepID=A0AAJ0FTF4_9HYPO|nr:hypothetical protein QQS21_011320 [Conoideocrella luteorostrata]
MASAENSPSSSTISGCSSSSPENVAAGREHGHLTSACPEAGSAAFCNTCHYARRRGAQPAWSHAPLNCEQPQQDSPLAASPYSTELDSAVKTSPTVKRPVNTTATSCYDWSRHGSMPSDKNQPIPSYMTPESIRARNILLKCDLPSKNSTTGTLEPPLPVKHVSFYETSQSSKRQKLDKPWIE